MNSPSRQSSQKAKTGVRPTASPRTASRCGASLFCCSSVPVHREKKRVSRTSVHRASQRRPAPAAYFGPRLRIAAIATRSGAARMQPQVLLRQLGRNLRYSLRDLDVVTQGLEASDETARGPGPVALVEVVDSQVCVGRALARSEERRVGKEWRSRWAPSDEKKVCQME